MIKMDRPAPFSPPHATPVFTQQQIYFDPMYASPADQNLHLDMSGQAMMTPNQPTHSRMVMHMGRDRNNHPAIHQPHFVPDQSASPYDQQAELSHADANMVFNGLVSPTDHLDHARHHAPRIQRNHSLPNASLQVRPSSAHARPTVTRNNSAQLPTRPAALNRQASLQAASARFPNSASPHLAAGDLFSPNPNPGSPIKRPATAMGIPLEDGHFDAAHPQDMFFNAAQGISPARALGPPPAQPLNFSPAHDLMVTPYGQRTTAYERHPPSSASSSAATSSSLSSSASSHHDERKPQEGSDDENDSPTKTSASRGMSSIQLNERPVAGPSRPSTRGQPAASAATRQQRPAAPQKAAPSGGRTSAKFAKVAEDPGVEGVPPGPRPMDRPGPSFACIIGQAILKSSAGGLSLEHIYRYVETAYPFFKTENAAWRNSVRHNLSIHKMFETIPRTEKFPPGKGGIWIIHEDEKCHWPEENKFIKNFPSTHPHHEHCRQTMHDRAKEQDQMERAAREGRVYVPKKGKNRRKLPLKDDEDSMAMMRSSSDIGRDSMMLPPPQPQQNPAPLIATPPTNSAQLPPSDAPNGQVDFEDDGDFLPMEEDTQPVEEQAVAASHEPKTMAPPRFELERKEKRVLDEDEENVFTSTKRVRLSSPAIMPLAPIMPQPQESVLLDDTFITPERERTMPSTKMMSSAYRTPMLVNTSSSPGSSPMPATITRGAHLPSALHQMWTPADHPESEGSPTSPRAGLDSAFNFQPKLSKTRARPIMSEDDYVPVSSANPPKTPLSRSSAARETKTPMLSKTPLSFGRSPAQIPPSVSALLSTPLWEQDGCLDRLKQSASSPTHLNRSPVPPTSPTRYAMLADGSASPAGRKMRDFSL